jgi:protein-disulfide isomerase
MGLLQLCINIHRIVGMKNLRKGSVTVGVLTFIIALLVIGGGIYFYSKNTSSLKNGGPATSRSVPDHLRFNTDAKVTIVIYDDFQCPACQAYYPLIEQALVDASSTVRLVFQEFPLPFHTNALPAAKAAEAARNQDQFWGMYDLLYLNHKDWDALSDPTSVFTSYAQRLGLNMPQFIADMDSPITAQKIQDSINAATKSGINATPTFFINGRHIINPQSYEEFIKDIQNAASSPTP